MHPLLASAVRAFQSGEYALCRTQCERGLTQRPGDADLLTLLAMSQQACNDITGAERTFAALRTARPEIAEFAINHGVMLRQLGRMADAEQAFLDALARDARQPDALLNYGLLLIEQGRVAEARHRLLDACEVPGHSAAVRIYASLACFECGDAHRADRLIPPSVAWPGIEGELRHELALALMQVGRVEEAESVLATLDPADPVVAAKRAHLYERTNRLPEAAALLAGLHGRSAALDPATRLSVLTAEAALAMRSKDFARAASAAQDVIRLDMPPQSKVQAYFTLATIADKQGRVDDAMAHLAEAHAIRLGLAADIAPELLDGRAEPLHIISRWSTEAPDYGVEDDAPPRDASPVFIVGFPRSGTTMLEQMLDAHPGFVSMDEQPILQRCIEVMQAHDFTYPTDLARVDAAERARLRAVYWDEVAKVVQVHPGQRLVDKNPLNMLRVPMIRRLFPNSPVILALRHPCDVLLSNYMQNFRAPTFMVLCSTLERLAQGYAKAMDFWIHHQPQLGTEPLILHYEQTVSDFPAQVQRIGEYLQVRDAHHFADFAAHAAAKGYIGTPSYAQVVEGVNTRAVARWERYRRYFEPVLPILAPVAAHWGYTLDRDRP